MIGRNDPCHCGSGKKYKKCHLNEDQGKARTLRSLSTPGQWVDFHWKTIESGLSEMVDGKLDLIKQRWDDTITSEQLNSFLVHHALLDAGQHTDSMSELIRQNEVQAPEKAEPFATCLSSSYLSCFEVSKCRRGQFIELSDKLSGTTVQIFDDALSQVLEPMEGLFGRIVQFEDRWHLLSGWSKLVFRARKHVFADVQNHYRDMGADLSDASEMKALLKRSPETLLAAVVRHNALPDASA
ncbi:MAG: YecA family protein [Bradymonadia bacterium]